MDEVSSRLERALHGIIADRVAAFETLGSDAAHYAAIAAEFVLAGGKRLRPQFAFWGWRAAVPPGAAGEEAMLDAACSLELLHASALAHDDLIDASDSRRGRPATHVLFAAMAAQRGWPGDAARFGAAGAILVGDLLLSWADSTFAAAQPSFTPDSATASRAMFDALHREVMVGQYLDVLEQARGEFSLEAAQRVVLLKTAKYTAERPLLIGAASAGAPSATLDALSRYGVAVGEAFQLRDDLLGVFGDPAMTGKPAGDDLREGKRTVLVALAMRAADEPGRALLRAGLGVRELDESAIEALRAVLVDSGAAEAVETMIGDRLAEGLRAVAEGADAGLLRPDAAAALTALARASADRVS
ncbi:MAG: polyprenyl synthetase family protein [Frankiaceae bacterium]|jgi:geranylgeranyl diphosphate synthase type I|nr:polyprenyl synthetase family protein [Frankiaceae bacterium]